MIFVDTNYFLRFLLADIGEQHRTAKELFKEAALGKVELVTSQIVFFEIYWVLSSFYKKEKRKIVDTLNSLLKMEFVLIENKDRLKKAVSMFAKEGFDLEDAYNLTFSKEMNAKGFATFDRDLARHL